MRKLRLSINIILQRRGDRKEKVVLTTTILQEEGD